MGGRGKSGKVEQLTETYSTKKQVPTFKIYSGVICQKLKVITKYEPD